jgi:hypothetical protein
MRAVVLPLSVLLAACVSTTPDKPADVDSLFADKEVAESRVSCLTDRGWDVELEDGAIVSTMPEAQREAYRADDKECLRGAGIDPDASATPEELANAYGWYSAIATCLWDHDWSVPDRPSIAEFRSSYNSDPWIPWSEVPAGDLPKAHELCPVMNIPAQ